MNSTAQQSLLSRFLADYGMILALLVLCIYFSIVTWDEQHPSGAEGGGQLAAEIVDQYGQNVNVFIVVRATSEDAAFAGALTTRLKEAGAEVVDVVHGQPPDVRRAIAAALAEGKKIDVIGCNNATSTWSVYRAIEGLEETPVVRPRSYYWPDFLKLDNLLNVANQISVIAIIAIGMTMVIITAGIDLSVGSLIALSAVVTTMLIRDYAGAREAGVLGMVLCCLGGMAVCGLSGAFSGVMVAIFRIPAFIVTLAMMLVANGLAYQIAEGQSNNQVPSSFKWLGVEADLLRLPNAVVLTMILYGIAHVIMTRTVLGRYIYAVGGNEEAARLSGVPVRRVLILVYVLSGLLAGLGGVVMASQLTSGSPTYGIMYELYVIAAVVVGGTSLAGGEGKIFGTLIGALIIAVIRNGMNLTEVEDFQQRVVLGLVILGAVLLDRLKKADWRRLLGRLG